MDSNLMSCPTCAHTVGNSTGACTYCGAMMEVQQTPSEEPYASVKMPETESPSNLSRNEISWTDEMPTDAELAAATEEKLDVQELQDEISPVIDDTGELAQIEAEVESVVDDILPLPELEVMDQLGEETGKSDTPEENIIELVESSAVRQDSEKSLAPIDPLPSTDESVEKAKIHSEEAVQTTNETDDAGEPETGLEPKSVGEATVLEIADEIQLEDGVPLQQSEPEALEEDIIELVESSAVQQDSEKPLTPIDPVSSDESLEKAKVHLEEASQTTNETDAAGKAAAGSMSGSIGETIFLEITDEIQLEDGEPLQKNEKTARSEPLTEALKIEKAAQDMKEAIEQQKAALAKAEADKKQKATLAKTRAQKKQKKILAKDAALKRKKAAQAKALQVKKQRATAKSTNNADNTGIVQGLEANTKMLALLEKYKGQAIGINYESSADIREAQFVDANCEYFRVFAEQKNLYYTYPIKSILTVIESQDGVEIGESKDKVKFNAVIKVYPAVPF